jgi:hypothetical protein
MPASGQVVSADRADTPLAGETAGWRDTRHAHVVGVCCSRSCCRRISAGVQ